MSEGRGLGTCDADASPEIARLFACVGALPEEMRERFALLATDLMEQSSLRRQALELAREGLQRLRLDLTAARFDLEATRRERARLAELLDELVGG